MIKKFADDTKIGCVVDNEEESHGLLEDIKLLVRWAEQWQMEFNSERYESQEPDDRVTPQGVFYRDLPHLINADGNYLFCRYWMPKTQPRALVMLIHSAGEHCGRYKRIIAMLLNQSLLVFAHDHIGHGQSEGPRIIVRDFKIYIRDCLQHIDMLKRMYPTLKLYLLSLCMGGTIAIYILRGRPGDIAGAIFIAPLLLMNPESATPQKMLMAKVMYHVVPNLPMGYIDPRLLSRDESQVQAYIDDPLVYHGPVRVRFSIEVLNALTKIEKLLPSITTPMLILHGDADSLSDIRGSYIMYGKVGSQDRTFKVFNQCFHELHHEIPSVIDEVMEIMKLWLQRRL
uniref:monoglyceride lipase-like n=1 Tax=Pristiophorus japonicus TaxID=55135 RepID=UPI00398F511C